MSVCKTHAHQHGRYPYYASRCQHSGNRFVIEIRSKATGFIIVDYVEIPDSGDPIVEACDPRTDADAEECWSKMTEKLTNGVSPDPSWGK